MAPPELEAYLQKTGIEPAATRVYVALLRLGPASALQLAKISGTSRTQTYRHLESLKQCGLVSGEGLSYGTLFRALPLENIEALIVAREAETTALKQDLGAMSELLQQLSGSSSPKATTQHFYGWAGIKQANWNLTKADKEFRVFEVAHLSEHLDQAFARRFRERIIERGVASYDLTNSTEVQAVNIEPFDRDRTYYRHINPGLLTINFEVYIYNDIVTLLDYSPDNPHTIEIHHPTLNRLMFQLYEAMWRLGEPLVIA